MKNEIDYVEITIGKRGAMGARYEKTKTLEYPKFKKLKISEIREIVETMVNSGWTKDNEKYDY